MQVRGGIGMIGILLARARPGLLSQKILVRHTLLSRQSFWWSGLFQSKPNVSRGWREGLCIRPLWNIRTMCWNLRSGCGCRLTGTCSALCTPRRWFRAGMLCDQVQWPVLGYHLLVAHTRQRERHIPELRVCGDLVSNAVRRAM